MRGGVRLPLCLCLPPAGLCPPPGALPTHSTLFNSPMRSISSAQKENIIALASNGQSTRKIASSLGVSQPTVVRALQNLLPNHQSPHSGCPSKLSATSECAIITQITTGKVANAIPPQSTSIPSSSTLSPHKLCAEFLKNIH